MANSTDYVCVWQGVGGAKDGGKRMETKWEGRETVSGCMESWVDSRQA